MSRPASSRRALPLALLAAAACSRGAPPAAAPEASAEPAGAATAAGPPSPAELLRQVEAARARIEASPKPVEVLLALGNLYAGEGRYVDAVDWFRQAIDATEPAWARLLALPAGARTAQPGAAARAACGPSVKGYEPLRRAAEARLAGGDAAGAAYCWRRALEPWIEARLRRGNAWHLAGGPDLAIADYEAILARVPGQPEATHDLGLALADAAGDDLARLRRARDLLARSARGDPRGARGAGARRALAEVDRRLAALTAAPAVAPAHAEGGAEAALPLDASHR